MSDTTTPTDDDERRRLLEDVAAGRISVDDAEWQLKNLQPKPTPADMAAALAARFKRGKRARFPWFAALMMALIGSVFLGVGVYTGRKTIEYRSVGVPVDGVVVRMIRNDQSYKPVVKYTVAGKDYEIEGDLSSKPPAFHVGEQVEVLHKPNDPADAVINSFSERWLFPLIFGGVGCLVGLGGWLILLYKLVKKLAPSSPAVDDPRFTIE